MFHCEVRSLIVCLSLHLLARVRHLSRFLFPPPPFSASATCARRSEHSLERAQTQACRRMRRLRGRKQCTRRVITMQVDHSNWCQLVFLFDFPPPSPPPCSFNLLVGLGQPCRWLCPFASRLQPPPLQKKKKVTPLCI